ncbi:hypothetical protein WH47_02587 [Habropoda laboriosa]|uniref:Uncharacterized protein n=1 Tax=Habropoda laboriosa TaxID=597456 RepID=A0A0L7QWH5_9HYME|nr:hypothetical protein WH47_02587 [Habropoda laboriosa]
MLPLGIYELTHPESLSEFELKEILENRCIDFSNYKNLSKLELIELYKRVALPLPQRQSKSSQNLDTERQNEATSSTNEFYRNSISSNGTNSMRTIKSRKIEAPKLFRTRPESPVNEVASKRICLHNLSNITKCNGVHKHKNDEKHDARIFINYL